MTQDELMQKVIKPQMDEINRHIVDATFAKIIAKDFDGDTKSSEILISLKEHGLTDFEFNLIVKKKQEVMDFLYTNFSEELL